MKFWYSTFSYLGMTTMIILVVFSSIAETTHAAPTYTINYQGKLTNNTGAAVADGLYDMEFKLYDALSGGTTLWTETRTGGNQVQVTNGLFSVMLGDVTSLTSVDFNQALYLGVNINSDGEMSPRKELGTVPSAFEARQLGGVASSSFLRSDQDDTASGLLTFSGGFISSASSTISQLSTGTSTITTLVIDGETVTDLTGTGITNVGGALTLDATGDWTGTFDGQEGSYYLANSFSTSSADYWETQQISRTADDLTNNSIQDLSDVAAMTESTGDLLSWNGSAWTNVATSSLGIGGSITADSLDFTEFADSMTLDANTTFDTTASYGLTLQSGVASINLGGDSVVISSTNYDINDTAFRAPNGAVGTPAFSFANDTNTGMYRSAADELSFSTNGTQRLRISSSGTVFANGDIESGLVQIDSGGSIYLDSYARIDADFSYISAGNFSLGTTTTPYQLTVAGDAYVTGSFIDSTHSSGTPGMVLQTTGSGTQWVATSSLGVGGLSAADIDTSAELRAILTDEVGAGAAYFVGGALGTPASVTLTNATGLPVATGISGLGTGIATWLSTPSSANLRTAVTDETGSGNLVFSASPTFTGTVTAGTIQAVTYDGLADSNANLRGDVSVVIDLDQDNDGVGSFIIRDGADSNVFSITESGIVNIGTWQGSAISSTYLDSNVILSSEIDTSAELRAILTDETGTGNAVFSNSPTFDNSFSITGSAGTLSQNSSGTAGDYNFFTTDSGVKKLSFYGSTGASTLDVEVLDGDFSVVAGNVAIGSTTANQKLEVYGNAIVGDGAAPAYLYFRPLSGGNPSLAYDDGSGFILNAQSNEDINFRDGGSGSNLFIGGATGSVGIGTTTPSGLLHVYGNSSGSTAIFDGGSAGANTTARFARAGTEYGALYNLASGGDFYVRASDPAGNLYLSGGNGSQQVTVAANGNLGIGTTNPTDVAATYNSVTVDGSEGGVLSLLSNGTESLRAIVNTAGTARLASTNNAGGLEFATNGVGSGNIRMKIDNAGNVGIGTTTPNALLQVHQNAALTGLHWPMVISSSPTGDIGEGLGIKFHHDIDGNADKWSGILGVSEADFSNSTGLAFYTHNSGSSPAEVMRIDKDGKVGIGTTSPNRRLESWNGSYQFAIYDTDPTVLNNNTGGTLFTSNNGLFSIQGTNWNGTGGAVRFQIDQTNGNTTLGTVTAGTWQGSAIASTYIADDFVRNSGDSMTGDLVLSSGSYLQFEDGDHRITNNDGGGNFNIRVGNYFSGGNDVYSETGAGAIHMNFSHETTNPSLVIDISPDPTSVTAGDTISWAQQFVLASSGGITWGGNTIWHAGNDGTGSTLDADLLDGTEAAAFVLETEIDTSAELASILTNETGTGAAVFASSPSISAPTITGTITTALTANRLVTVGAANQLTTSITSTNLAASVTDETGTGNLVFSASPTFTGTAVFGNTRATTFDSLTDSNANLRGDVNVVIDLDQDNDGAGSFIIRDGTDSNVFNINESGIVTTGIWQGSTISSTYLDSNIILSSQIDTSAELRGILTDETGTGNAVFASSPTLGGLVSISGTAAGSAYDGLLVGNTSGTTGSAARVYLSGSDTTARSAYVEGINTEVSSGNEHALAFGVSSAGAAPTERMRIDDQGRVGIGETNPAYLLDLEKAASGTTETLINLDGAAGAPDLRLQVGSDGGGHNGSNLSFTAFGVGSGNMRGQFESGNWGTGYNFGTGAAAGPKVVATIESGGTGASAGTQYGMFRLFEVDDAGAGYSATRGAGTTNILLSAQSTIDSYLDAGNFGLKTTNPSADLTIGDSSVTEALGILIESDDDATLTLRADTNNADEAANPYILLEQDGELVTGIIGLTPSLGSGPDNSLYTNALNNTLLISADASAGALQLGTNGAARMTVLNNGNVGIGNTAPVSIFEVGTDGGGAANLITIGKGFDSESGIQFSRGSVIDASITSDASENLIFAIDKTNALASNKFSFQANGSEVFAINDAGQVTSGTWQGAVISSTYLDAAVILSSEIDTSAELRAILTDETGTGAAVFASSPSLTSPDINAAFAQYITFDNQEPTNLSADGQLGFDSSRGLILYRTQQVGQATGNGGYTVLDTSNITGGTGLTISNTGANTAGTEAITFAVDSSVLLDSEIDTSTELRAILTDETGTGAAVFANAPQFTGNSAGFEYGIDGRYSDVGGSTGFGATIWSLDTNWQGTASGGSYNPTGVYGMAWLRNANTNADANVGEGLYGFVNGTREWGIGNSGFEIGTGQFTISSGGVVSAGTWQGSAIASAYLDNNVILSSEIDTSAELRAILSDETGTGNAVFSASPTFTGTAVFGNTQATTFDSLTDSNANLRGDVSVVIDLDQDNDGSGSFIIRNGADTNVFNINESGSVTTGTWAGSAITAAYLNDSYLLDTTDTLTGNLTVTGTAFVNTIEAGNGSGGVALNVNDGGGNANLTFNHDSKIPDSSGSAARIRSAVDGTTADMLFQLADNVTSGVSVDTSTILGLLTSRSYFTTDVGIGETSPDKRLEVFETVADDQFRISYDATRYADFQVTSVGDLVIDAQGGDVTLADENLFICSGGSCASTPNGTGNITAERAITSEETTLSTSGSITVNWDDGNQQRVNSSTGNLTFNFSNATAGQTLRLVVCFGGSHTITWTPTIRWAGGSAPTPTSTSGKCDVFSFLYTGTAYFGQPSLNF